MADKGIPKEGISQDIRAPSVSYPPCLLTTKFTVPQHDQPSHLNLLRISLSKLEHVLRFLLLILGTLHSGVEHCERQRMMRCGKFDNQRIRIQREWKSSRPSCRPPHSLLRYCQCVWLIFDNGVKRVEKQSTN